MTLEDDPSRLYRRDEQHLRTALLSSRNSNAPNFKMGAVIAKGKRILGIGYNNVRKTHPSSTTPYNHIHAELSAMLNARCDMRGATLYVFRAGKDDRPLISKPCQHCQTLIEKEGIKTVVFSIKDGFRKMSAAQLVGA